MQSPTHKRTLILKSPQQVKVRKLKLSYVPKNVKLKNINIKKNIRSRSLPYSLNPFTKIESLPKSSILITQTSIGSQRNIRKNKPSIEISKPEPFKQRRRSCECTFCGEMSHFQKESMNHEFIVQQIEKERESPMHKFSRSIRKHQIYLMAPYLFAKDTPEPPILVREQTIKLTKHNTLLDVIKQEDGVIQSSKILDRTPTKKISFFDSFIEKQKEITSHLKNKLVNKQFSSLSYHLLSRKTYKCAPLQKLPCLTPKHESPLLSERSSTKKSEHLIRELYITPYISQYPSKFRLATLPDFNPNS